MQKVKQLALILVGAGAILGLKVYNKSSMHDEMKAELVKACEGEAPCVAAVGTHFDACFDENYDLGGKRRSAGVNTQGFLSCFNTKSGEKHFEADTETAQLEPEPDAAKAGEQPAH